MSENNKPTHRAYATFDNSTDKTTWRELGALWPHKDGKGYTLRLDLIPRNDRDIVIRLIEPKEQ